MRTCSTRKPSPAIASRACAIGTAITVLAFGVGAGQASHRAADGGAYSLGYEAGAPPEVPVRVFPLDVPAVPSPVGRGPVYTPGPPVDPGSHDA